MDFSLPERSTAGEGVRRSVESTDLVFRPLSSVNAYEETVNRLAQAIKLGVVAVGSAFPPERELAASLHVSRSTLRHAIRALELAGHVEIRRGRGGGTFVLESEFTPSGGRAPKMPRSLGTELVGTLDFRRAVEPLAAELAAERCTKQDAASLREVLDLSRTIDISEFRRVDAQLHLTIAAAAHSPLVAAVVADLQMALNDLLTAFPPLEQSVRHSHTQHSKIIEAILGGHGEIARSLMEQHIAATASLLRGLVEGGGKRRAARKSS